MTAAGSADAPSNPLRRAWQDDRCAIGAWVLSPDPLMAEALALAGFEWICIDLQHGWLGLEALPQVVQAVAVAGSVPIVRVPANEPWLIGRALDAGGYGVMVPLVDTPDQALRAVASCRYPPAGRRSYGAYRPAPLIAASPRQADRELVAIVQIESRTALERLDEICAVPGLDAVYVGPGDLALSLGLPSSRDHDPATLTAVAETARRHGVAPGMHGESGVQARWAVEHGFALTTAGADVDFLHGAARRALTVASGADPGTSSRRAAPGSIPRIAV